MLLCNQYYIAGTDVPLRGRCWMWIAVIAPLGGYVSWQTQQ